MNSSKFGIFFDTINLKMISQIINWNYPEISNTSGISYVWGTTLYQIDNIQNIYLTSTMSRSKRNILESVENFYRTWKNMDDLIYNFLIAKKIYLNKLIEWSFIYVILYLRIFQIEPWLYRKVVINSSLFLFQSQKLSFTSFQILYNRLYIMLWLVEHP